MNRLRLDVSLLSPLSFGNIVGGSTYLHIVYSAFTLGLRFSVGHMSLWPHEAIFDECSPLYSLFNVSLS